MPTYIRHPERELGIALYRTPEEVNQAEDLEALLRTKKVKALLLRRNPITDDVWHFVVNVAGDPAARAVVAAALYGVLKLWTEHTKGRRIEIQRPNLRVKAPSISALRKILDALHKYDEVELTVMHGKSKRKVKSRGKAKSAAGKKTSPGRKSTTTRGKLS